MRPSVGEVILIFGKDNFKEVFKVSEVTDTDFVATSLQNPTCHKTLLLDRGSYHPCPPLTYVPQVDAIILSYLEEEEVRIASSVNQYIREIYQDNLYWSLLTKRKFPGLLHGRFPGESWENFYRFLSQAVDRNGLLDMKMLVSQGRIRFLEQNFDRITVAVANWAAAEGKLDILEWIKIPPTQSGINSAAGNGHLHILIWAAERKYPKPNQYGINLAAKNGHLHILDWCIKRGLPKPDRAGINWAAENGHLHILVWSKIIPTITGANLAAKNGHFEIILFLASRKVFPTVVGVNQAAGNGHLDIVKHLTGRVKPRITGANLAAGNGFLDVVTWIADTYAFYPNQNGLRLAARNGQTHIVEWMLQHKIRPIGPSVANEAAKNGHIKILNLIGMMPSEEGVDEAAGNGHLEILDLVYQKDKILPSLDGLNKAAARGKLNVIVWVSQKDPKARPDQRGINAAAENGHLDIIKWVGILPDQTGVNKAAENGHLEILIYVLEWGGPRPDEEGINGAAENGHTFILEWAFPHTQISQYGVDLAAGEGRLDTVKWIKEHLDLLPSQEGIGWAALYGHIDILEWKDLPSETLPNEDNLDCAVSWGKIDSLLWAEKKGISFTEDMADSAAHEGYVDILEYFRQQDSPVLPSREGVRLAIMRNRVNVIEWMERVGVLGLGMPEDAAAIAVEFGAIDVLDWFRRRRYHLVVERGIHRAVEDGYTDIILWLDEYLPKTLTRKTIPHNSLAKAINRGCLDLLPLLRERLDLDWGKLNSHTTVCPDTLSWLKREGLLPRVELLKEIAISCGSIDALEWLIEKEGVEINQGDANNAVEDKKLYILKWMYRRFNRLSPDQRGVNLLAGESDEDHDIINWLSLLREKPVE